jgi:hypothetical protein
VRNDDLHTNESIHGQFFLAGKIRYFTFYIPLQFYVGIHSKIQAYFFRQDIKKTTVRNYRMDIGIIFYFYPKIDQDMAKNNKVVWGVVSYMRPQLENSFKVREKADKKINLYPHCS